MSRPVKSGTLSTELRIVAVSRTFITSGVTR